MIDEKKLIEDIKAECEIDTGGLYVDKIIGVIHSQPKVGEWIPVSVRLPDDRKEKLVCLSSGRMTVAIYNEHRLPHSDYSIGWGYRVYDGYIDFEQETVIAWQPLPEPFKGE